MTIATFIAFKLKLGSCNAHNTTVSRINVKKLPYVVKTSSIKTIRMSIYKIILLSSFGSSNIQISYSQVDIVTYITSCYRLTPRLTECKQFLLNAP